MARCGCRTQCSCVVQGCDNRSGGDTVVTGDGSLDNPYVVCTEPECWQVRDTASVNLTLDGDGHDDCRVLGADVIRSQEPGNTLEERPDGLYAGGSVVTGCPDGTITVTGTGTAADPYVVCGTPGVPPAFVWQDTESINGEVLYDAATNTYTLVASVIELPLAQAIDRGTQNVVIPPSGGACLVANSGPIATVTAAAAGLFDVGASWRDNNMGVNLDATIGIIIRQNGAIIAQDRMTRQTAQTYVPNARITTLAAAGDVFTVEFSVHSEAGATQPHTLVGSNSDNYIQIVQRPSQYVAATA